MSINTRNECIIFCYGKQLSTKLTAVIFHCVYLFERLVSYGLIAFVLVENVSMGTMVKMRRLNKSKMWKMEKKLSSEWNENEAERLLK